MKRNESIVFKILILVSAIIPIPFYGFFYPLLLSLMLGTFAPDMVVPTLDQTVKSWVLLGGYWVALIPFYISLILAWIIACSLRREGKVTKKTVKLFKASFFILAISAGVFLLANVVLSIAGWEVSPELYCVLTVIKFAFAGVAYLLWSQTRNMV